MYIRIFVLLLACCVAFASGCADGNSATENQAEEEYSEAIDLVDQQPSKPIVRNVEPETKTESKTKTNQLDKPARQPKPAKENTVQITQINLPPKRKEKKDLNKLFEQVEVAISEYNRCSDFLLIKGKRRITLTGATASLSGLQPDLPKSDSLKSNKVIQVSDELCDFVIGVRNIQIPKTKTEPMLKGPGRQEVESPEQLQAVKLKFAYDTKAKFARIYYLEWFPSANIIEHVNLKNIDSVRQAFGGSTLPLDATGKAFSLEHAEYGALKMSGYGARMFALVQSDSDLTLDITSPDNWLMSVQNAKMKKTSKILVAVAWLELY